MAAIKTMAVVDQANQLGRVLPPEAFYNELIRCRSCRPLHWHCCPPVASLTSDVEHVYCGQSDGNPVSCKGGL